MGVVCVGVKEVEAIGFGMHSTAGLEQVTVAVLSHVMAVQAKGGEAQEDPAPADEVKFWHSIPVLL